MGGALLDEWRQSGNAVMSPKTSPVGSIRLCGTQTYHQHETLCVVFDDEAAIRGVPGVVTIEQAKSLVAAGEAVWLSPLPRLPTDRSKHEGVGAQ